ncbi:MAG: DUF177 domain-containing protein [Bacilli bacterium]
MKIDITKLINNFTPVIDVDEQINFGEDYLNKTEIRQLNDVKIKGTISKDESNIYNLNLNITGVMVLPCAVSLEDVNYPFSFEIGEILTNMEEEDENYIKFDDNSIDILPIIWQNIVMEIPLKVLSPKLDRRNIAGIGWELITEDEENN